MADLHLPVLDGFEQVPGFQVGDDLPAGVETVGSGEGAGRGVERSVGIEDVDDPDLVLVRPRRRSRWDRGPGGS